MCDEKRLSHTSQINNTKLSLHKKWKLSSQLPFFIYIGSMIDIYLLAKNPLVFQKQRTITSAYIDVSSKMGLAQTVLMVQDNFTENFGTLKMDNFCVNEKGGY